jgi:hypothetical protein
MNILATQVSCTHLCRASGAEVMLDVRAEQERLAQDRVHDRLRMLIKRGCVRQVGCTTDGAPVHVLP